MNRKAWNDGWMEKQGRNGMKENDGKMDEHSVEAMVIQLGIIV